MKFIALVFALSIYANAQDAPTPKPTEAPPTLSSADRVSIAALEQQKQELQKKLNDAQQLERTILKEWSLKNPGWILDSVSFVPRKYTDPHQPQK